jgi:hypothetical protein
MGNTCCRDHAANTCGRSENRSPPSLHCARRRDRRRAADVRTVQSALVRYLFDSRDPDKSLKKWIEGFAEQVLSPAFSREGTLREKEKNVVALSKLTDVGKELEHSTIATFSGTAGFTPPSQPYYSAFRQRLGI